jgi:hypothetical protein
MDVDSQSPVTLPRHDAPDHGGRRLSFAGKSLCRKFMVSRLTTYKVRNVRCLQIEVDKVQISTPSSLDRELD